MLVENELLISAWLQAVTSGYNWQGVTRMIVQSARGLGILMAAAAIVISPVAKADEKPHPIIAEVKATVKDPDKPFTLIVHIHAKKGAGEKLEAAVARATKLTLREKGCLRYELNRDPKAPTHYLLYERWQSLPLLAAHLKAEHITKLLAELGELIEAAPKVDILVPAGE
jgi:quinol monooxygenase YgiN